jgi:hypothetical protein
VPVSFEARPGGRTVRARGRFVRKTTPADNQARASPVGRSSLGDAEQTRGQKDKDKCADQ